MHVGKDRERLRLELPGRSPGERPKSGKWWCDGVRDEGADDEVRCRQMISVATREGKKGQKDTEEKHINIPQK